MSNITTTPLEITPKFIPKPVKSPAKPRPSGHFSQQFYDLLASSGIPVHKLEDGKGCKMTWNCDIGECDCGNQGKNCNERCICRTDDKPKPTPTIVLGSW